MNRCLISIVLFLIAFGLLGVPGCTDERDSGPDSAEYIWDSGVELGPPGDPPRTAFAELCSVNVPAFTPQVPPLPLPLDLGAGTLNWTKVKSFAGVSADAENLVRQNGFALVQAGIGNCFVEPYTSLKDADIPIFVTTDTVLHLYHVAFDCALRAVEEEEFFGDVVAFSSAMANAMKAMYNSEEGELKEAARLAMAFFAVGRKCVDPNAAVPDEVASQVAAEIHRIETHAGFAVSPLFDYYEDYSQYKPRGHYTRSEVLKKYFKAMMWYGRLTMLLKGGQDALVDKYTARIQTLAACAIAAKLSDVTAGGRSVKEIWDRMYAVTAFFVGAADDLTPHEYRRAMLDVCGSAFTLASLADEETFQEVRAALVQMRKPRIYGGTGNIDLPPNYTKEDIDEALAKTQGMRFMGQRFIPDSYWFQNLVNLNYTGTGQPFTWVMSATGPMRGFPRGLDVMSVLGSERASEIIHAEGDADYELDGKTYDEIVAGLRAEVAELDEKDWNQNLYFGWLYTLKSLLEPHGAGFPTFMQTRAWTDKQLQTALASWAQLRHDTILYAKQSYTMGTTSVPLPPEDAGYVEPNPQFYARLINLCEMTKNGLAGYNALPAAISARLDNLIAMLEKLLDISVRELKNETLSPEDYEYIRTFASAAQGALVEEWDDMVSTELIADVHTDCNTEECLEEATGRVDWLVVAFALPTGDVQVGVGPAFSYYEFKQDMSNRLTDEEWAGMLESATMPARPGWTSSFSR